jgi:signal peptidase I
VLAGAALTLLVAAGRFTRYEIAEHSMEPALRPGDWVLAIRSPRRIRRGHVVVAEHPSRPGFDVVKRVAAVAGEPVPGLGVTVPPGGVWLLGDNPEAGSVDSRTLGSFPLDAVRARVVARYHPKPRRIG